MNRISEIIEIPKFISFYVNNNPIEPNMAEYYTHTFCEYLLNNDYIEISKASNGKSKLIYDVCDDSNLDIKDAKIFAKFYLDKSILDCKLGCKYEEETCISKSLTNEVFKIVLYDKEYYAYIESLEYGRLNLIIL